MTEGNQIFRSAVRADLEGIVGMLADDHLGRTRENPDLPLERSYEEAFLAISQDPNNELIVAERNGNLQVSCSSRFSHPSRTGEAGGR